MTPARSRGPQQPSGQQQPTRQPDNGLLSGGRLRDSPLGSGRLFSSSAFNGGFPSSGSLRGNSLISSSFPIGSLLGCSYLDSILLSSRLLRRSRPSLLGSSSSSGLPSSGHLKQGPNMPRCGPIWGTLCPTPYAMLPGPPTAYLDDEGLQDRGMFKYARVYAHTCTHT